MNAQQAYQDLLQDQGFRHAANWLFSRKPGRVTKLWKLRNAGYSSAVLNMYSADPRLALTGEKEAVRLTLAELDALKFKGNEPVFTKIVDRKREKQDDHQAASNPVLHSSRKRRSDGISG